MAASTTLPGLYIHVPFCVTKCPYCNFFSIADRSLVSPYLEALRLESGLYAGEFDSFDTIYLGGGTPSTLSPDELSSIFETVHKTFAIADNCEATIEVNPGDLTADFVSFLRDTPLNRVNLGVQSFDEDVLQYLGRRHNGKDSRASLELLRNKGFANIGLDLIYGIPGQTMGSWMATLEEALRCNPEHLSCYELTLEPGTPLGQQCSAGGQGALPDEDDRYNLFMATAEHLETAGYIHYEVSNFARRDTLRSRHNMKYWDHTPYLGLGPSAHSFIGTRRWWNRCSLDGYCTALLTGIRPVEESEFLTDNDLRLERIFLGLRTREGIARNDLKSREQQGNSLLDRCFADGLLSPDGVRIIPTRRGFALADQLAAML